jgi:hypothetical protein
MQKYSERVPISNIGIHTLRNIILVVMNILRLAANLRRESQQPYP